MSFGITLGLKLSVCFSNNGYFGLLKVTPATDKACHRTSKRYLIMQQ